MAGANYAEIGKRVGITERTVKHYVHSLCFRYGVLPSLEREKILPGVRLAVAIHAAGHCPCGLCAARRNETNSGSITQGNGNGRRRIGADNTGLPRLEAHLPTGWTVEAKRGNGRNQRLSG